MTEYLDVIDEHNVVVDTVSKKEIYEKKLPHRIVHVFVQRSSGAIVLSKRSKDVKYLPGYWVTAAAGHVSAGETFQDAGIREAQEEIGLNLSPQHIGNYWFNSRHGMKKYIAALIATCDETLKPHPREVSETIELMPDQLDDFLSNNPAHPETVFLLSQKEVTDRIFGKHPSFD